MNAIRVLLADDQPMIRAGFAMILDAQPGIDVIGEASDGDEAVAAARATQPDVVVMDVQMPSRDGLSATHEICAALPSVKVLIVTTFDIDDYVYQALQAGASGFLLKNAAPEDLVHAVRVVASGDALLAPSVTRRLIQRFTRIPMAQSNAAALGELTSREMEVLQLVAKGYSNSDIAAELVLGIGTVKTHVAHILTKLNLRDRVQAVVLAYEAGLVTPARDAQNRSQPDG